MICPKCNTVLKEGAKFCHVCGFSSVETPVSPQIQQQTPVQNIVNTSFLESKFFTFINPYIKQIDNGNFFREPFSWLYIIIAAANILFPFYVFYKAIDIHIFDTPAKFIIAFLLIWIVIAAAGWLSSQLWWNRKSKVRLTSEGNDDFVATPVFSHFIQTLGEWAGSWLAVVGFFITLFGIIFLGDNSRELAYATGIPIEKGAVGLILFPVYGFLIVVFSRFLAEIFRAFAAIANNTKKMAGTVEKDKS